MFSEAIHPFWVPCQLNEQFVPAFTVQSADRQEPQTVVKNGIDSLMGLLTK
jgi:hypothetical protein